MTRLFAGTPFDIPPECDICGKLLSQCDCTAAAKAEREREIQVRADRLEPKQQTARIGLQKRKGGRQVTVVEGLTDKANNLPVLLARLQSECGTGGTVKPKDDLIELQGDHLAKVRQSLAEIGYRIGN